MREDLETEVGGEGGIGGGEVEVEWVECGWGSGEGVCWGCSGGIDGSSGTGVE